MLYRIEVCGKLAGIFCGCFMTGFCSPSDYFCDITDLQISQRQETAGAAGADESEPAEV